MTVGFRQILPPKDKTDIPSFIPQAEGSSTSALQPPNALTIIYFFISRVYAQLGDSGGKYVDYMLMPLMRYADFSGRSRRLEYWMFTLFYILTIALLVSLAIFFGSPSGQPHTLAENYFLVVTALFVLGTIIPSVAVTVRRFHDQDKSGWFYCLSFIPYIGGFIMLVFMCFDGTPGPNSYGPDPKDRTVYRHADIFS